jgi:hypothetical protein
MENLKRENEFSLLIDTSYKGNQLYGAYITEIMQSSTIELRIECNMTCWNEVSWYDEYVTLLKPVKMPSRLVPILIHFVLWLVSRGKCWISDRWTDAFQRADSASKLRGQDGWRPIGCTHGASRGDPERRTGQQLVSNVSTSDLRSCNI